MSLTLAFDTSSDFCSAAFLLDGKVICECSKEFLRGHAEKLVPMIKNIGKESGLEISDVDLIAVTVGPGSYTGVRTGLAAAHGFSLASGVPAVGVSCFAAVVRGAIRHISAACPVLCVIETRRKDYFGQLYDSTGQVLTSPRVMGQNELRDVIEFYSPTLCGNGVSRLISSLSARYLNVEHVPDSYKPQPVDIAAIAESIISKTKDVRETLSPLYLREPQAKLSNDHGSQKK
ncbi:MAG: tRNA (adenosine(37)-N6)-threonylcarbamoyltransferase complex dimerization subunit type 1 TsaB [Pseudomonadota bacterium]|nr:tRNA (adenosine(37)-N6)-threonylcarbamoyltransferase complex dimerization subunit type 1 TsaB [Pseudomonadota bacterium]